MLAIIDRINTFENIIKIAKEFKKLIKKLIIENKKEIADKDKFAREIKRFNDALNIIDLDKEQRFEYSKWFAKQYIDGEDINEIISTIIKYHQNKIDRPINSFESLEDLLHFLKEDPFKREVTPISTKELEEGKGASEIFSRFTENLPIDPYEKKTLNYKMEKLFRSGISINDILEKVKRIYLFQ